MDPPLTIVVARIILFTIEVRNDIFESGYGLLYDRDLPQLIVTDRAKPILQGYDQLASALL